MKLFLKKATLFFSIILIAIFGISLFEKKDTTSSDYMEAIIDKHQLLEDTQPPRIIFCGGSNLPFGIDSETIERELGLPVVNLGLHAGLGLLFMINEIKYSAKENDIVFLSIEYFLRPLGQYDLQKHTSDIFPEAHGFYQNNIYYDAKLYLQNIHQTFKSLFLQKKQVMDPVYTRKSFNKYGDLISHLDLPPKKKLSDANLLTKRIWKGISILNDFHKVAEEKKFRVFFLFPPYAASEYEKNKNVIGELAQDLRKNLKIPIVNQPDDFVYPDGYFYDTVYHLNREGRRLRTQKLISLIRGLSLATLDKE